MNTGAELPALYFFLPVFPEKPRTGGEIFNRHLVDDLRKSEWPIDVVSVESLVGLEKMHRPESAAEVGLALKRKLDLIQRTHALGKSEKVIIFFDSWLYKFLWRLVFFKKRTGKFVFISFSQLCYWDTFKSFFARQKHRMMTILALWPCQLHVGVSEAVLKADLGPFSNAEKDLILYPGCDFAEAEPALADCEKIPAQIVSIGNYTPRKGFHILISALALVFSKKPELKGKLSLRLIGNRSFNPDYLQSLEDLVESNCLGDSVLLDDWKNRDEISSILSESQMFAFASESEGFGMVVAEAMFHGLPVLLGDFMTAAELTGNGAAGYVVNRFSPEDFAQAIIRHFIGQEKRKIGLNARKRAVSIVGAWSNVAEKFKVFIKTKVLKLVSKI